MRTYILNTEQLLRKKHEVLKEISYQNNISTWCFSNIWYIRKLTNNRNYKF